MRIGKGMNKMAFLYTPNTALAKLLLPHAVNHQYSITSSLTDRCLEDCLRVSEIKGTARPVFLGINPTNSTEPCLYVLELEDRNPANRGYTPVLFIANLGSIASRTQINTSDHAKDPEVLSNRVNKVAQTLGLHMTREGKQLLQK